MLRQFGSTCLLLFSIYFSTIHCRDPNFLFQAADMYEDKNVILFGLFNKTRLDAINLYIIPTVFLPEFTFPYLLFNDKMALCAFYRVGELSWYHYVLAVISPFTAYFVCFLPLVLILILVCIMAVIEVLQLMRMLQNLKKSVLVMAVLALLCVPFQMLDHILMLNFSSGTRILFSAAVSIFVRYIIESEKYMIHGPRTLPQ
jgi:hypothetical protein